MTGDDGSPIDHSRCDTRWPPRDGGFDFGICPVLALETNALEAFFDEYGAAKAGLSSPSIDDLTVWAATLWIAVDTEIRRRSHGHGKG